MKYLIVSGDSNTTDDFDSISHPDKNFSYKKWPTLLGEKLGMKVINLAGAGQGNEFIYTTIRDEIVKIEDKNQIGLVIAAWTEAPRRDFKKFISIFNYWSDKDVSPWSSLRIDTHGTLPWWVDRSLGYYLDFEILCERYNIPYVQFQMIELFEDYLKGYSSQTEKHHGADPDKQKKYPGIKKKDEELALKSIMKYKKKLDTSKFMGWPPVKKLGGWTFKDQLDLWYDKNSPRRVSTLDDHPNELGHIAICNKLIMLLQEYNICKTS